MKNHWTHLQGIWKLIVLLFLVIVTFSYAMFQGGFVSWFLFYSFLPFAFYGLALAFYSLTDIEVERVLLKKEFNAGETLKAEVRLSRRIAFPLFYIVIEDCLGESLAFSRQQKQAKTFLTPGFRRELSFQYTIDEMPRGEHALKAIRVKTGDPLGLIEKEQRIAADDKVIVYPAFEELIYRPLENHYDQGMTASKERVQRDTSMAIGIREYQPGDRFSWINWKATAKRNDIMTKQFEQRQSHDVFIMMDCAPEGRFEIIVSFTASIIRAILRKGAQVGLISSSDERAAFPIRGGEVQQQQLFYHLAKVRDASPVMLDRILETETFLTQQNVTIMLVTAQLTKQLIERAGYFAQRKSSVVLFLIKNEKESPSQNELTLKAAATARGIRVVMIHNGLFKEAFSEVNR
ncbi:DUF58 domain-containing protein [Bacillus canaveralius]|uniref:DUF58 domain-containing protein n=1 Tax=Bacillus canaveralius TaxID=1403243 RepID=UPI000F77243A|nr:DUF58 domain-containing protein [Bacillus canaveralius]RSK57099.1 DUF58 domain-containing protein [Bacillus canaveralius]